MLKPMIVEGESCWIQKFWIQGLLNVRVVEYKIVESKNMNVRVIESKVF